MNDTAAAIREHYARREQEAAVVARVSDMLDASGIDPITARALAPFDQFHVRGLAATTELAALAGIEKSTKVLDAGSGFGGPARYLADAFGCSVTGIDLTPAFVAVSRLLTDRAGLGARVTFDIGDLQALPYADAAFDVVWTQHVVMNVRDRAAAYAEFRRVLEPGGKVAFYDVVAADDEPEPILPVPWAQSADTNFLLTEVETRAAFASAGLRVTTWRDTSADVIAWFASGPSPATGFNLIALLGPRLAEMTQNFARNLREGRIRVVMGIATAS